MPTSRLGVWTFVTSALQFLFLLSLLKWLLCIKMKKELCLSRSKIFFLVVWSLAEKHRKTQISKDVLLQNGSVACFSLLGAGVQTQDLWILVLTDTSAYILVPCCPPTNLVYLFETSLIYIKMRRFLQLTATKCIVTVPIYSSTVLMMTRTLSLC